MFNCVLLFNPATNLDDTKTILNPQATNIMTNNGNKNFRKSYNV
jgi:hypothetical protein